LYKINLDKNGHDAIDSDSRHNESQDRPSTLVNRVNEGILAGRKIAKLSVITLISIGIAELITGYFSGSVVAFADGVDSISDAMISFIVYVGLGFTHRPADKKFQFGYHKVESFAAMIAAIGMILIGCFITYHSYEGLVDPKEIKQPIVTMIVLAVAGTISTYRALQMRNIANKYNLLSLKTDAKNSIKDGSASLIGFLSVLIASQFGFLQADAIGGMVIAGYIFSVAYISLKQSSLILIDAWHNPATIDYVTKAVEEKFDGGVKVRSVKLRQTGMVSQAEVHIEMDGNSPLREVENILLKTELVIKSKIPTMYRVLVVPHAS
jgi:cation diffusion facilitator family transporter